VPADPVLLGQVVLAGEGDGELALPDPPAQIGLDLLPERDAAAGVGWPRPVSRTASRSHVHLASGFAAFAAGAEFSGLSGK
jgi:hypothetical protein